MTVSNSINKAGPYVGDDAATSFAFTYKVLAVGDLVVARQNTDGSIETLTYATDYTVSLNADQDASPGGSITYPVTGDPLTTTEYLTILREIDVTQESDITNLGGFYPDIIETMADRAAMIGQQNAELGSRAVRVPRGFSANTDLLEITPEAGRVLRWNDAGDGIDSITVTDPDAVSAAASAANAAASESVVAANAAAALSSEINAAASALNAGTSETAATASEIAAAASEAAAEAARDAAIVNSTMYADEATGRAAVLDGEYFKVIGSGNVACYEYVRVDASNSTLVAVYPASAYVTGVKDDSDELEDAFTDVLTIDAAVTTVNTANGRVQSPEPLANMLVTPVFVGDDPDTAVVPVSVKVTGKNILTDKSDAWESGQLDTSGNDSASGSRLRLKAYQKIAPNTQYSHQGGLWISLYDDAGVHQRQLTSTPFTTAANETQYRVYFVMTSANPYRVREQEPQIEASAVATAYEQYYETVKTYDGTELFAYGTYIDSITGNTLDQKISKHTIDGSYVTGSASTTNYYVFYLTQTWSVGMAGIVVGRDPINGDYPAAYDTWNNDQKQIWGGVDGGLTRINIAKTIIDAEAGATVNEKGANYLNANPVEVFLQIPNGNGLANAARGALILPKYGSVVLETSGTASHDLDFQEVSLGGGGGAVLTGRVADLESNDTTQDSTLTSLQTQIDDLIIGSGTSDAETIAARTSAIGSIVNTTLKNRLDRMEETAGRVNVQDYGAVGDGVTDDTVAILAARDAAEANDMVLHFPRCADAYMIRNGILLTKSTIVTGVEDGPIRKIAAVSSPVNGAVSIGDTVIPVDDSTGFVVGYDVYVGKPTSTSSYAGLRGTITAVDAGGPNEITVEAYNNSGGTGMIAAFADGEAVASMTFPMIYTDKVVSGATAISPQVRGVHLDGNVQAGEPQAYTISLIHFDTGQTTANTTYGCIFRNSPADAVSDQGSGWSIHAYNRMYANAYHGIHIGFTNSGTVIVGNYADGNGQDGVYYCYGNTNTRCYGNFFENMPYGFAEVGGQEDGDTILFGNITKNCDVDYQGGINFGPVIIESFLSLENNTALFTADTSSQVIKLKGTCDGGAGGVVLTRISNVVIDVDFFGFTGDYCVSIANAGAVRSSDVSVFGQMHGATVASVLVQSSDDCLIAPSISKPTGVVSDIIIATDGAQAPCDSIHCGFGFRKNGITDAGTNTVDAML